MGVAQGQTYFNPAVSNTFTDIGGFSGQFTPPSPYAQARLDFEFTDSPVAPGSFTITGIGLKGEGITGSLSFSNVGVTDKIEYLTNRVNLDSSVSPVDFANNLVSFTLPGGVIPADTSFTVSVQYRTTDGLQINTSTPVTFVATPEPSTWVMAAGGLACAAWTATRRRRLA